MGMEILTDNPVFLREIRRRMRGRGLAVTLCVYIAAMCLGTLVIISRNSDLIEAQRFGSGQRGAGGASHVTASDIGRELSNAILAIQALLVLIVAPTLTAAMVRSEKERQTFDFLRGTALSASTYVVGALLSTLLYVALALFCALPVLMISYLYGGVSDLVQITFGFLGLSVLLSSGGLLISCVTERGRTAHAALGMGLAAGLIYFYLPWLNAAPGAWALNFAGCVVVSLLMLVIAARKLFSPEERALNYRQLAALYLGSMLSILVWAVSAGAPSTANAGAGAAPTAVQVQTLLATLVGLGVAVQTISMAGSSAIGSERWRIRRRLHLTDSFDAASVFAAAATAAAAVVAFAGLLLVGVAPGRAPFVLLPGVAFLILHGTACWIFARNVQKGGSLLRWILAVDVVLLLAPPLFNQAAGAARGAPNGSGWADAAALSPIEAGMILMVQPGAGAIALLNPANAALCTILLIAWLRSKRPAAQHSRN